MDTQERIGAWCSWGVILLSWIGLFLVLALMFRATSCNRSSEAGTQSMDVIAESANLGRDPATRFAEGATTQSQFSAGVVVRF